MVIFRAAFAVVYLPLLAAYFFSETGGNFTRRAANKIGMASLFLLCGGAWFFMGSYSGWAYLGLAGLFFAWLGDVLLLWSFVKGGASFAAGNVLFILYEALLLKEAGVPLARIAWIIPLFLILWGGLAVLSARRWIDFGRLGALLVPYMATVTGMGVLGLGLAASAPGLHPRLLGLGLALFMVSDYFLMAYKFKYRRDAVLRANSAAYFIGMLLAALSFSF